MNSRRAPLQSVFPLALVLSAAAVLVALVLEAAGDVSAPVLAVTVAAVGFVSSWVMTGRSTRTPAASGGHGRVRPHRPHHHRVATVPVRHSVG